MASWRGRDDRRPPRAEEVFRIQGEAYFLLRVLANDKVQGLTHRDTVEAIRNRFQPVWK